MSIKTLSGIFIKGLSFLAILMPVCAQSTTANTLQHPRDQIALQLGAIQMGYTTAGTAFQLVTGNATNAQQAANALVMGKNALDATVAKPAVKVQGVVDSPSVDTVEYRDQLYSAVEQVVTSPVVGTVRGQATLEGGKKVSAAVRLSGPPNTWTIPVPFALESRSSADVQALRDELVSAGVLNEQGNSTPSTDTFGTGNNTFDLEFVSIGNPMNAADPDTNLGAVSYPYRISKYTISQKNWDKAVASGLQNAASSTDHGGVGLAGENTPTNNASWYEAAAFVNWLNTSKGYQSAYNLTFSNGAWGMQLWSVEDSWSQGGVNRYRHKNAHYFLPSDNEWYKAAYYDPKKPSGAGYWMYPTGSDAPPEQVSNTGTGKGGAGWNYGGAGTDPGTTVYGLASWSAPADVNACGGLSPYGTMGQGGNVAQWIETSSNGLNSDPQANRRAMGYAYYFDSTHLGKAGDYETKNLSHRYEYGGTIGIRVASKKD
jgi:sulfatase modifying factor 1